MIRAICSWCHHRNIIAGPRVYCASCGHRADVARLACDCGACLSATWRAGKEDQGGRPPGRDQHRR